jgi:hypothetical protein
MNPGWGAAPCVLKRSFRKKNEFWEANRMSREKSAARVPATKKKTDSSARGAQRVHGHFVQIRAELAGAELPVWREFTVERGITLAELHSILQILFEWDEAHLFLFEVGKVRYGADPESGERDYIDVEIGTIAESATKMIYRYDFGDDWEVALSLKRVDSSEGDLIWLSDGAGAGPLEDCGGIFRHNEIVQALRGEDELDPELREWIPEGYDPARFDLQAMRRELAALEVALDNPDPDDFDEDDFEEDDDEDPFASLGADLLSAFPLDDHGEPVLYDPNDRRGPDPERWAALSEEERLQSIAAYHGGDPLVENSSGFSLHCSLHLAIEAQVLERHPREVAQALDRLTAGGRGRRHSAVHLLSVGFVELIRRQTEGDERAFEAYARWVEELPQDAVERFSDGGEPPEFPQLTSKKGPSLRSIPRGKG